MNVLFKEFLSYYCRLVILRIQLIRSVAGSTKYLLAGTR